MSDSAPFDARKQADAFKHCAALARENARDEWLAALFAPAGSRDALFALASFDYEIRQAGRPARDPNLAALRLAWWREAALGRRDAEAAGSPVALGFRTTVVAFALPAEAVEAMLDARLTELAPPRRFTLADFERYAAESEGARLRLASRIAAGAQDLDAQAAHEPAGMAMALTRMLLSLSSPAGARLFPADVAQRHGARGDFDARRGSSGVVAAAAELRALARERLREAERRLSASPPPILPAFVPLGALHLDLGWLERDAARPFERPREVSAFRRQWAIWRWSRRF